MEYEGYELKLSSGDRLFLYTDGVTEAQLSERNMFGMERIPDILNKDPDASPKEMILKMKKAINEFVGSGEQFDDITMLALSIQ